MKSKIQGLGCIVILLGILGVIGYFGYHWIQDQVEAVPEITTEPEPTALIMTETVTAIVTETVTTNTPASIENLDAVVVVYPSWSLKVFENPNHDSLITAWLLEGSDVTVTACNGTWAYVGVGWVNSEWLEPDYCEVE